MVGGGPVPLPILGVVYCFLGERCHKEQSSKGPGNPTTHNLISPPNCVPSCCRTLQSLYSCLAFCSQIPQKNLRQSSLPTKSFQKNSPDKFGFHTLILRVLPVGSCGSACGSAEEPASFLEVSATSSGLETSSCSRISDRFSLSSPARSLQDFLLTPNFLLARLLNTWPIGGAAAPSGLLLSSQA